MTEERKVAIPVTVDATGAKQGFGEIKGAAQDMAQAVAQSGQQAGTGLDSGIVAAVKRASAATDQASQSILTWTGFLKQNMGPAMKEALDAGATHAEAHSAAIKKIALDWAAYKETVKSAGAGAANAAAGIAQGTTAAAAASDKLTASQARLMSELQRLSVVNTQGKAAWLEQRAAMLGLSEQATPYIAKIKEAEQSQVNLGLSAKQTAFALRGVPAQFTDIITSLQMGQRPMTVLLQQGGQLKDMFGGIAPAAKALGGYVMGFVTPLTVGAAAVGVLAYSLLEGSKELKAFQNAATITGNAIGQSASQFVAMRDGIAGIVGTKGKAAEVLTEIAANGKIAGTNIKGIAEAAILMERATGQATAKTIEQFAGLAKTPSEAAAKLNEQYNFLTAGVYKQIKALEEQGKVTQATSLAETAYADALKTRAQTVLDNAGIIEKAWRGITGAAKSAWDSMLGIGRTLSPAEKMAVAAADVARIQAQIAGVGAFGETGGGAATGGASASRKAALEKELATAKEALATAQRRVEIEARNSHEKAEQNRLAELGIAFEKQGDEFKTKAQRRQEELTKAQVEGQQLVNAGIITQTELTKRLNDIRQKYIENTGQSEVAALRGRQKDVLEQLAKLRAQNTGPTAGMDPKLLPDTQLTQSEKDRNKILQELQTNLSNVARAEKVKALAVAEATIPSDKALEVEKKIAANLQDYRKAAEKQVADTLASTAAIKKQADAQEAANTVWGKGKIAIAEMTLAKMKEDVRARDQEGYTDRQTEALRNHVTEQERLVKALQVDAYKTLNQGAEEYARTVAEQSKMFADEARLAGLTALERDKILAIRKVDLEVAKKIAAIDRQTLSTDPAEDARLKQEQRDKINLTAVQEKSNAVAKVVADDWNKTAESINNSLTDALLRGFESGKTFAQNFRDTLVNMFKTLVLRPIIQGVLAPVSGALTGVTQSITGGTALSNASGAMGLYNGGTSMLGGISSAYTTAAAGGVFDASVAAAGVTEGVMTAGGMGAGLTAAMSAIPVWGWAALGAAAIAAFLSKGGGPKQGGYFGAATINPAGEAVGGMDTPSTELAKIAQSSISSMNASFDKLAGLFGGTAGTRFGIGVSTDPQGKSPTFAEVTARNAAGQGVYSSIDLNVGRSQEELTARLTAMTTDALIAALKASDLDKPFADFFNAVAADASQEAKQAAIQTASDVSSYTQPLKDIGGVFSQLASLSVEARAGMIEAAGGLQALAAATSAYYENFYSAEEQRAITIGRIGTAFAGVGLSLDGIDLSATAARGQFRAIVDSLDLSTEAGRKQYTALMTVAGAFASVTPAAEAVAAAAGDAAAPLETLADAMEQLRNPMRTVEDIARGIFGLEKERSGLQVSLMRAQGNDTGANALQRSIDTAGFTEAEVAIYDYNQSIRDQIQAIQDAAQAAKDAAQASADAMRDFQSAQDRAYEQSVAAAQRVADQKYGLETQLLQAQGNTASLRERELAALDPANRALQTLIWSLTDAADAAAKAAAAEQAVADQKYGLETRLLTVQGDTAELRARERAALDESNRALYDRIVALEDEKTAAAEATRALEERRAQLRTGTDDAFAAVQRAVDAQRKIVQASIDVAQEQVTALAGVFDLLKEQVRSLYAETASTAAMGAAAGRNFIDQALGAARTTGYMPEQDALSNAINAARGGLKEDNYASRIDLDRDRLVLAAKLGSLQEIAGIQKGVAEQQLEAAKAQMDALDGILENAKAQIDALRGVDTSVLSVKAALDILAKSILAEKAGAAGPVVSPAAGTTGGSAGTVEAVGVTAYRMWLEAYKNILGANYSDAAAASSKQTYWLKYGNTGVPAFVGGGDFAGGLRMVGERGPELEITGAARYFSASDTRSMLDNSRVVAAINRLGEYLDRIESHGKTTSEATEKTSKVLSRVTRDGEGMVPAT